MSFEQVRTLAQEISRCILIHQNTEFPFQVVPIACAKRRCAAGESGLQCLTVRKSPVLYSGHGIHGNLPSSFLTFQPIKRWFLWFSFNFLSLLFQSMVIIIPDSCIIIIYYTIKLLKDHIRLSLVFFIKGKYINLH